MAEPGFSEILGAFGAERLRAHMAERRLLHLPAPGLDFGGLLSRAEYEEALTGGDLPPQSAQVFTGYRDMHADKLGLFKGGLDRNQLDTLASRRTTLVATKLDRVLPKLWKLARDAEQALGDQVGIGAILSHGEATGIDLHFDPESLIIVQLEGEKTWRFYGPPVTGSCLPKEARPAAPENPPVTHELVMRPGDLLYVPSGLRHQCAPGGLSFHLGILIRHQSGSAVMAELRDAARADAEAFDPLVRFLGEGAVEAQAEAYKARLLELLAATDARALLDRRLTLRSEEFAPGTAAD